MIESILRRGIFLCVRSNAIAVASLAWARAHYGPIILMIHVEFVNLKRNFGLCQADFHKWAKAQLKWRTRALFAYNQAIDAKMVHLNP